MKLNILSSIAIALCLASCGSSGSSSSSSSSSTSDSDSVSAQQNDVNNGNITTADSLSADSVKIDTVDPNIPAGAFCKLTIEDGSDIYLLKDGNIKCTNPNIVGGWENSPTVSGMIELSYSDIRYDGEYVYLISDEGDAYLINGGGSGGCKIIGYDKRSGQLYILVYEGDLLYVTDLLDLETAPVIWFNNQ